MRNIVFCMILVCCFSIQSGCKQLINLSKVNNENLVNRTLSKNEMRIPSGRYQGYFCTGRSIQVEFPGPQDKPSIKWSSRCDNCSIQNQIIADSDIGIWHYCSDDPTSETVKQYNFDGKTSSDDDDHDGMLYPQIILDDAIIVIRMTGFGDGDLSLVCQDKKGDTIWESVAVPCSKFHPKAWLISNYRIMADSGDECSGDYNIYSLENGDLIKNISFPDWGADNIYPIELNEGGWIGFKKETVVCYSRKMKQIWEYKYDLDPAGFRGFMLQPLLLSSDTLILGTDEYLVALDIKTGKEFWKMKGSFAPLGITRDGNFITSASTREDVTMEDIRAMQSVDEIRESVMPTPKLMKIERSGTVVWSIPNIVMSLPNGFNIVEFSDGGILFGDWSGLKYADKNGTVKWEIDKSEFGFTEDSSIYETYLFPLSDGRIAYQATDVSFGTTIALLE